MGKKLTLAEYVASIFEHSKSAYEGFEEAVKSEAPEIYKAAKAEQKKLQEKLDLK